MSLIWADNFETYGTDQFNLLDGFYADIGGSLWENATQLVVPSFETENRHWLYSSGRGASVRRVLGGAYAALGIAFGFRIPVLPPANNRQFLMVMRNEANEPVARVYLTSTGNVEIRNDADTVVVATTNSPVTAGFFYRMQLQTTMGEGTGSIEVRLSGQEDGEELTPIIGGLSSVPATNLDLPGTISQLSWGISDAVSNQGASTYYKYIVPYSLTGTYNSSWPRITGVATLQLTGDTSEDDFIPRPFQMFGNGVLFVSNDGTGDLLDCGANVLFGLADGDFTIEGTFRYGGEPAIGAAATLFGLWSASTSQRSYRLVKYPATTNDGALRWEITTDGTLGTLQAVVDVQYTFEIGHQYAIAVCREAGVTRLFIDGVQIGVDYADANTYFNVGTSAKFTIGGEISGTGATVLANSSFKGHVDEFRVTPGVARYNANYTPATDKFPRNDIDDPDFDSVVLLAGFDEAVVDESNYVRTLTTRGNCARQTWFDGGTLYESASTLDPNDTRYIEAPFISATGVLTMTILPVAGEAVVLGATTYTFRASVSVANDVLIGATIADTLENLFNAITGGPGSGSTYGSGTVVNASATASLGPDIEFQLTATALTAGTAGNSIVSTTTVTGADWTGATLAGGVNIPDPVEFTISPLPINATGLRGLFLVDRAFLGSDTGSAQKSFVVNGAAADGADNSLSTVPTLRGDMIEEDPDTNAGLTPQSVLIGRIRYTRTS